MADPAILRQMFVRIGLTQAVANRLVDNNGINSISILTKLEPESIDRLVKTIRHPGANAAGHEVPFQVQQHIKDVTWLLKHRLRTSRDLDVPNINLPVLTEELEIYRTHEEQWSDPETLGVEVNRKDWTKTFRVLEEAFADYKGVHGAPLSYVIRESKAVPANPDPPTNYADIPDEIIARAPIQTTADPPSDVATFKTDNTALWKLMSALFKDTVDWTDIKHCARTKNGRKAYLDLKSARLGAQHTSNISSEIEKRWLNLNYAGPKRNWKFDDYARAHKECYLHLAELEGYQEPDARTRVRKLIDQISTRELDTSINMILASSTMITDFDAAVAHIKGFLGNREDTLVSGKRGRDGRSIASVDTRHRPPNDWKQLAKEERDEILEERRRKKQKRENGDKEKDKDKDKGSKSQQGKKKGRRDTFKELKRRIAELESKQSARDDDGNADGDDDNDNQGANTGGNRNNPALQRRTGN